jgi:hypothetical protein
MTEEIQKVQVEKFFFCHYIIMQLICHTLYERMSLW